MASKELRIRKMRPTLQEKDRARVLYEFLGEENLQQIRNFVDRDPLTLFGVYQRGMPYVSAMGAALGIEGYDFFTYPVHVTSDGRQVYGFQKNILAGRKVIVVDEMYQVDHDAISYKIAITAKRFRERKQAGMVDFRLATANPFSLRTENEIIEDKFFSDIRKGKVEINPEELGQDVSVFLKASREEKLDEKDVVVPAGNPILAIGFVINRYGRSPSRVSRTFLQEDELTQPEGRILVVGSDEQVYRRLVERYGQEKVVFKTPSDIVR